MLDKKLFGVKQLLDAYAKPLFWLAFVVLSTLFLIPQEYLIPEVFDWWDKLQHSLAFGVLSLLGFLAYSRTHNQILAMVIAMVIYGAVIELAQSLTGWRYGEFRDWLADTLGVAIAWIIYRYFLKRRSA